MKKHFTYLIAFALPFVFGCTQGGNKENKESMTLTAQDTVMQCYVATFDGDTAILNVKINDSLEVEGDLMMKYAQKAHNKGIVRGKFQGDTLFVDYTFKTGENTTQYSNPLAFLKTGKDLKMGVGQIETAYGRSYFVIGKPINYEQGKFNFMPTDCK